MEFIYPQFLYGLAALAIPIIIHLFNFRKAKRIYFSNNFFLRNLKKISSSKLKLKHYLILAARLLFITFLVFAFAQPFIPASDKNLSNENVLIYLDNSHSMSNEVASGLSAFEQSLNYIDQIVNLYPPMAKYKLLTNDFAPFSNNFKSKDEINELITEVTYSGVTRNFDEISKRLIDPQLSAAKRNDVYFISDFQQSTIGDLSQVSIDTNLNYFMVPMDYEKTSNVFVDSIYLENPFLMINDNNILHVVLSNNGKEDLNELSLKLFVNDVQTANLSLDIPANGKGKVDFPLNFSLENVNRCRLSIEDYPVTFDNEFYFTLNMSDRIKVLEIKNEGSITNIDKVYANQSLFNLLSYNIDNLDYSLINEVDLIVLNSLGSIDNALAELITNFVQEGGSLCFIPASLPDIAYITRLSGRNVVAAQNQEMSDLASPPLQNPFYENIFEATDETFEMPKAKKVLQWNDRSNALLFFKNQDPYLSDFKIGEGNLYLFGSPLKTEFTSLPKHAIFVPLMYRMAALSKKVRNNLYYSLNENVIKVQLDSAIQSQIYRLAGTENEVIPPQQLNGNTVLLEIPKFEISSGFYQLMTNDQVITTLAFNQSKAESRMEQISANDLQKSFNSNNAVEIFTFNDADDFSREMRTNRIGTPYWKYALMLSLFFLFTEILLIRLL